MKRHVEKCSALCICDDMMIIIYILEPTDFQKIKHMLGLLCTLYLWWYDAIHPKSEKVGGHCFLAHKNLAEKVRKSRH